MTQGIQQVITNAGEVIAGLTTANFDQRINREPEASSGTLHETAQYYTRFAPMFRGTSRQLGQLGLFTNADAPSYKISQFDMYAATQNDDAPGYAAGNVHVKFAATDGNCFLDAINWSGDSASFDFTAFFIAADGSTEAVTRTTNNALPTPVIFNQATTLTSLTFGGQSLGTIDNLSINIAHGAENNVMETCYNLGLVHPVKMAMPGAHGPIMVSGEIGAKDIAIAPSSGDLVAVFTQRADGGTIGTATITVTINAHVEPARSMDGNQGSPVTTPLRFNGLNDGSNLPITIVVS